MSSKFSKSKQKNEKKEDTLTINTNTDNSTISPKKTNNNIKAKKLNKVKTTKKSSENKNIKTNETINLKNDENTSGLISNSKKEITASENNNNQNSLTNISTTQIINELPNNEVLQNKINYKIYKINFVFFGEDYSITLKENNTMLNLRKKISKLLNLNMNQLSIFYYKGYEISDDYNDTSIKDYFYFPKNKSRPLLIVKLKQNKHNSLSKSHNNSVEYFNHDNKVKIYNYPSTVESNYGSEMKIDIYSLLNRFFYKNYLKTDFHIEKFTDINDNNENNINYIIGFTSPDIAFDFNRYMNTLKLSNAIFKDIKIQLLLSKKKIKTKKTEDSEKNERKQNNRYSAFWNLDEDNVEKRNIEVINLIRDRFANSKKFQRKCFLDFNSISNPYISPYEEYQKNQKENKKKWLNPEGFITSVNKYSGVQI